MAATIDEMSPEASPETLNPAAGVRRVNNWPMAIVLSVLLAFVAIVVWVASRRAQTTAEIEPAVAAQADSTQRLAEDIVGGRPVGMIAEKSQTNAPPPIPPSRQGPAPLLQGPSSGQQGQQAPSSFRGSGRNSRPRSRSQAAETEGNGKLREARLEAYLEALQSGTSVEMPEVARTGTEGGGADDDVGMRLATVRRRLEAMQGDGMVGASRPQSASAQAGFGTGASPGSGGSGEAYRQFDNEGGDGRWRLGSQAKAPPTPYILRTGFVLPATLISGINSELPGQITAQVSQNVYDSPTGNWLLVPQGAQLVGSYGTDVIFGQNRVLVAWQRINFPDGRSLDIGAMPGADDAGYTGFADKVDNHYVRLFGSALLMSGVTAGAALSQGEGATGSALAAPNAGSVLSAALGQQLGQATAQLLIKNMNVAPTLEIRPGYGFHVVVTKDLEFSKPYREFDY